MELASYTQLLTHDPATRFRNHGDSHERSRVNRPLGGLLGLRGKGLLAKKGKRLPDLELDLFVMGNQLKIRTVRGNEPGAVRSRCERDQEVKM